MKRKETQRNEKPFKLHNLEVGKGGLPPLLSGTQPQRWQATLPTPELACLSCYSVAASIV
ncbi:MAG: hypothetical protein QOF62_243 [Pyrinomonadaceae bacterium]|jgi:hypothetical protein|nr:hypothetical protein [Pyrinomonadaceae bacterium]